MFRVYVCAYADMCTGTYSHVYACTYGCMCTNQKAAERAAASHLAAQKQISAHLLCTHVYDICICIYTYL